MSVHNQLPFSGKIKFFAEDKGFGFIVPDDGGDDMFFHIKAWNASGLEGTTPESDMKVDYDAELGRNGKYAASKIALAE